MIQGHKGVNGMKLQILCAMGCVAMLSPIGFAQDDEARAKLNGSWQEQGGAAPAVWTIEQQGSTGLHITNSQGDKKIAEFICQFAKECEARDAGKKVKIMFYFNGPKLVLMETKGEIVTKMRFGFGDAAEVMELETIPVAPSGSAQTAHYTRVSATATASATKP